MMVIQRPTRSSEGFKLSLKFEIILNSVYISLDIFYMYITGDGTINTWEKPM